jgi:peptide deformylase
LKQLPIYTFGFDILKKKTRKIYKVDDKLVELVRNMFHTMHKANGIGLAAPQIGLDIALTVIDISRTDENGHYEPLTLLNPKILDSHGEDSAEEGCLSIPYVRAEVARPAEVYLEYQDLDLNKKTIELKGFLGRVAQHEIDHLNGILFIDHITKEDRKILKGELDNIKKGHIMTDYILAEIKNKNKSGAKKVVKNKP